MNPDNSTRPMCDSKQRESNQNNSTVMNHHQSSLVNGIQHYESMDWEQPSEQSDRTHHYTTNSLSTRPPKRSNRSIVSQVGPDYEIEDSSGVELYNPQPYSYNAMRTLVNSFTPPDMSATGLDADAAFALKLQQEEYSRDTMHVNKFGYIRGQPTATGGATATSHIEANHHQAAAMSDAEYAAMLQAEEDRLAREQRRYKAPPQPRIRPEPKPSQLSQAIGHSEERDPPPIPPFFRVVTQNSDTDDDDEARIGRYDGARHFFEMMTRHNASRNNQMPNLIRILNGGSRRRTGNLSDNPDDFGPDDYERLLELDKSIKKKTLSQIQINQIPIEKFHRNPNQQEEDIVCSICLDNYEDGAELRRFTCTHTFHKDCADRWLKENNICPICRETVLAVSRSSQSKTRRNDNDRSNRRGSNPHGRSNHYHRPPHYPQRNQDNRSS